MQHIPNELAQNFVTAEGRRKLMDLYGDSKTSFRGSNSDGEAVDLSISRNGIQLTTYQDNGWLRVDVYDARGNKESERFEGRWRSRKKATEDLPAGKNAVPKAISDAAETLNPNYSTRHNNIVFASDVCKAVLQKFSLPEEIRNQLRASIQTLDTIARR